MGVTPAPGEKYTIRRKVFKVFGAAFHVYDEHGSIIGYCKQKAFKLKEDIKLYTGEDMSELLLSLQAKSVIDFSSTYTITLPDRTSLGSMRRKGMRSSFVRDEWIMFSESGEELGIIRETGSVAPLIRRYADFAAFLFPQRYEVIRSTDSKVIGHFRQHFNPFIYRLGIAIIEEDDGIDELYILGSACLISAIEGRQD